MTIVMKFGGTSMASAETIQHCADLVRRYSEEHRVVTVVSAMSGVTDQLVELADIAASSDRARVDEILAELRHRHQKAAAALDERPTWDRINAILDELDTLAAGIFAVGEVTPRSRDAILSFGERLSSTLIAAALGGVALTGHEAGIVTDDNHTEAEPLMKLSLFQVKQALTPRLDAGEHVVVTGFLAATQHEVTTTIGRGGSDYTATIVGAALEADEIWIWSDVDGLMSADPRVVESAHLLDHITFSEAIEMGQFGAKSMHPRALEPAAEYNIPVRMRNTFNPDLAGTRIDNEAPPGPPVRCVLRLKNTALLTITGAAMVGRPGTAARIFTELAEANINIQLISQSVSEAAITIVIPASQLERAQAAIDRRLIRTGIAHAVDTIDEAHVVAVVGADMSGAPGIAARVFTAVAEQQVNIIAIAQGSSELSICFVVRGEDSATAVGALHEAFGLAKT